MSSTPSTIAGAAFLADPAYQRVIDVVAVEGDQAFAVGGAVRNTLMGLAVADVDIATTALPDVVIARARAAGLKAVPTGIEHGTVTIVSEHVGFEVTTLRSDVETDGRRATVAFTLDVAEDAGRRDFTMNAIYADLDGSLIDPTGGVADALARRVRFIGDPRERIREDYLRILRFFRFHAAFGRDDLDPEGLAACVELAEGLDRLSRERIGQELRKLLPAAGAAATVTLMAETGVLSHVIGEAGNPQCFAYLADLAAEKHVAVDVALGLAALSEADGATLADRLRLSRAEQERIGALREIAAALGPAPSEREVKLSVYRADNATTTGALLLAAAVAGAALSPQFALAATFQAPHFPVTGRQLIAEGWPPGPELGLRLAELEAAWIEEVFGKEETD